MPPPPDRVSAAAARRARWAVVWGLAAWFTGVTLHQWGVFVIVAAGVGDRSVDAPWRVRAAAWPLVDARGFPPPT